MTQPAANPTHTVARAGYANPLTLGIKVTDPSFVKVLVDTTLLDPSDYTISGIGSEDGVEITILGADLPGWFPDATYVTASFEPPITQPADLSAGGVFGLAFENAIDAIVRIIISIKGALDRTLKVPPGVPGDMVLPAPSPKAVIAWNDTGDGFINGPNADELSALTGVAAGRALVYPAAGPQVYDAGNRRIGNVGAAVDLDDVVTLRQLRQLGNKFFFTSVQDLQADATMGYAGSGADITVTAGDPGDAQGFAYRVAAPDASETWVVENANGVKFYPAPLQNGGASVLQLGGGTGNAATDGAALEKLVAFIRDTGIRGSVYLTPGTYLMTKGLSLPSGCRWVCPETARLDFSGVPTLSLPLSQGLRGCVVGNGARSAIPDLASDVSKGAFVVTFASPHGLTAGQVFDIYDPTDFSFSPGNAIFRKGQRFRVMHIIDGTNVQVDEPSDFNFAASVVDCYKHNSWSGHIEGIDVVGNGDTAAYVMGVAVDYSADVSLKRVSVSGGVSYIGVSIGRSIDVDLDWCRVTEDGINSSGNDYGFANLSSRRVRTSNSQFAAARHGVTHGTISGDLPFAKTSFRDCSDASLVVAAEASSWDYHGGGYDNYVENCTFSNGLILSGKGPFKFVDCTMGNIKPYGFCVVASQPAGGMYEFIRTKVIVRDVTVGTVAGLFHLGAGSPVQSACLVEDATYRIRDIDIDGDIAGQPYIFHVGTDNATYKINVDVDGVADNNDTSRVAVLRCFYHASMPIAADFIRVLNVRKLVAGGEYARFHSDYPIPARYSFDDQGGVVSMNSGTGAFISQMVTYRHKYPTQLPIQAFTDINTPFQVGGEMIDARALSKTYQNLNFNAYTLSGNNFPVDTPITATWRVGCGN